MKISKNELILCGLRARRIVGRDVPPDRLLAVAVEQLLHADLPPRCAGLGRAVHGRDGLVVPPHGEKVEGLLLVDVATYDR